MIVLTAKVTDSCSNWIVFSPCLFMQPAHLLELRVQGSCCSVCALPPVSEQQQVFICAGGVAPAALKWCWEVDFKVTPTAHC